MRRGNLMSYGIVTAAKGRLAMTQEFVASCWLKYKKYFVIFSFENIKCFTSSQKCR